VKVFITAAIVAVGDIVERSGMCLQGIELRVYEAGSAPKLLVYVIVSSMTRRANRARATSCWDTT
jgi:hypothetical protein